MFLEPVKANLDKLPENKRNENYFANIKDVIQQKVNPALSTLKEFLEWRYIPATRQEAGVWSLPNGKEFYKACLRWHLSFEMLPEEVHERGLQEVARLTKCFQDVIEQVHFKGTLLEFFAHLQKEESFYHSSKEDLLEEYKSVIVNQK